MGLKKHSTSDNTKDMSKKEADSERRARATDAKNAKVLNNVLGRANNYGRNRGTR